MIDFRSSMKVFVSQSGSFAGFQIALPPNKTASPQKPIYPIIHPPHLPILLNNHGSWQRRHEHKLSHWRQEEGRKGTSRPVFFQIPSLTKLPVLYKVRPIHHRRFSVSASAGFALLLLLLVSDLAGSCLGGFRLWVFVLVCV